MKKNGAAAKPLPHESGELEGLVRERTTELTAAIAVLRRDLALSEASGPREDAELEQLVVARTAELTAAIAVLRRDLARSVAEAPEVLLLKEKLQKITDNLPILLSIRDPQGALTYVNKCWERTLGWTLEDLRRRNLDILTDLALDDETLGRMRTFQKEASGRWVEFKIRLRNESVLDMVWMAFRLSDGSGVTLGQDLTERKAIEPQMLRAQRLESIGTLAGGIAHDLNNALSPITVGLSLFRRDVHDEKMLQIVELLEKSAHRAAGMVRQVLTFARGSDDERSIVGSELLVDEVTNLAIETFPKTIRVHATVAKGLWPFLGNATQIHQVLVNLCVNSRDAMPKGGDLTLAARNVSIEPKEAQLFPGALPGPHLVLSVSDTGDGIRREDLIRIFDQFYTTKAIGKGTGLGLHTCLMIVRSHGGFIDVQSELGKGTTFQVYLPAQPVAHVPPIPVPAKDIPAGNGEVILLVDDEAMVRQIAARALETYGYEGLQAGDGAEAVAILAKEQERVRLAIVDMSMPLMDGPATIRAMRRIKPDLRIVVASGTVRPDQKALVIELGAGSFLEKPYTTQALLETVAKVLKV